MFKKDLVLFVLVCVECPYSARFVVANDVKISRLLQLLAACMFPSDQKFSSICGFEVMIFYPRDTMLARVFATETCLSVRPSVCLSRAGIVPSTAKAGS